MHDPHFGSSHLVDAVDRAHEANRLHRVEANVRPQLKEAKRLYGLAIESARLGIAELEGQPQYESLIAEARGMISRWESEAYTL